MEGSRSGWSHGPQAGTLLAGRFSVIGVIGRGGMGIVVRAMDEVTGDEVAVKHVRPDLAEDPDYATRLVREAQLAKDVSHHNVCRVHDVYKHDDVVLLSMEYVEGETLRARLNRGRLPRAEALSIAHQICAGVAAAHQKGVVHRDLKPENVLIDKRGRVVVLDFGVARKEGTPRETMTGLVQGTPRYMAPEQQQGRAVSPATDVFALGLVIEELFGDHPPAGLRAIIRRATERDPQRRYPDAAALGRDLAHPLLRRSLLPLTLGTPVALISVLLLAGQAGPLGLLLRPLHPGAGAATGLPDPQPTLISRQWGNANLGTVSPDGKLLAYTEDCDGLRMGYLRPLGDAQTRMRQFSDPRHSVTWINFSPDGKHLVYSTGRFAIDRQSQIYLVDVAADGTPVLPGRRLSDGMTPSWFPDGQNLVFSRYNSVTGRIHLARIPASGGDPLVIPTSPPNPLEVAPAVSPDGQRIAFELNLGIQVVSVQGQGQHRLDVSATYPDRLAWSQDGRFLFFSSQERGLQAIAADGAGPVVPLLDVSHEARSPSISRGGVMVYTRQPDRFDLRLADPTGKNPRTISLPIPVAQISWPVYSRDSRLIAAMVTSDEAVRQEPLPNVNPPRTLVAVGKGMKPLVFIDHDRSLIVLDKDQLRVLPLTSAPAPAVQSFPGETAAVVSSDGRLATTRTVAQAGAANGIWVRGLLDPPDKAECWIEDGMGTPAWSADGKLLVAGTTTSLLAISSGPGRSRTLQLHDSDKQVIATRNVRFLGNDKVLFLAQPSVYELDLKTEQVRPYLRFPGLAYIFGFDLSPDGHDVAFVAQEPTSDLWMLKDTDRLLRNHLLPR